MNALIGFDAVISSLRDALAARLWPSVPNRVFYTRAFRNLNQRGQLVAEVFTKNAEYKEVMFDDRYNINVFFDVEDTVDQIQSGAQTKGKINIIFQINLSKLYPTLKYRAIDEVHRDALNAIEQTHGGTVVPVSIVQGLQAYGDLSVAQLKSYNMQPWHVFAINVDALISYDCSDVSSQYSGMEEIDSNEYPFPVIFTT